MTGLAVVALLTVAGAVALASLAVLAGWAWFLAGAARVALTEE